MHITIHFRRWCFSFAVTLFLSACSQVEQQVSTEATGPISQSTAVVELWHEGVQHTKYGEYALAKSKLERALRIESSNGHLWFALAQVQKAQGNLSEARNLARRAQSFAGGDSQLQAAIAEFLGESKF